MNTGPLRFEDWRRWPSFWNVNRCFGVQEDRFLHCIVTGEEKWIYYNLKKERNREDSSVMLLRHRLGQILTLPRPCFVFRGTRTVFSHYKLLTWKEADSKTVSKSIDAIDLINARKLPYYEQWHEKRIVQLENARPHVAKPIMHT